MGKGGALPHQGQHPEAACARNSVPDFFWSALLYPREQPEQLRTPLDEAAATEFYRIPQNKTKSTNMLQGRWSGLPDFLFCDFSVPDLRNIRIFRDNFLAF